MTTTTNATLTPAQRLDVARWMLDHNPQTVKWFGDLGWMLDAGERSDHGAFREPLDRYLLLTCNGDKVSKYGWLSSVGALADALSGMELSLLDSYPSTPLLILDLDRVALVPFEVRVQLDQPEPYNPDAEVTP